MRVVKGVAAVYGELVLEEARQAWGARARLGLMWWLRERLFRIEMPLEEEEDLCDE